MHELFRNCIDDGVSLPSGGTSRYGTQDEVGHIDGLDVEEHIKVFVGQFVGEGLGKEAVLQVVMLGGGMVLNGVEATMMVGEHETVVAHHHAGTEATQLHDGIVERRSFRAVQLLWSQFQT